MSKELVEQHYKDNYKKLVNIVLRRVDRKHFLAEEAVQEAFTRALTYSHCYDSKVNKFGAWFNTILNNSVRDLMDQERNRGVSHELVDNIPDVSYDLDREYYRLKIRRKIESYKEGLHKELLDLYFNKSVDYSAIVLITDASSEAMVRKVVQRFKETIVEGL